MLKAQAKRRPLQAMLMAIPKVIASWCTSSHMHDTEIVLCLVCGMVNEDKFALHVSCTGFTQAMSVASACSWNDLSVGRLATTG